VLLKARISHRNWSNSCLKLYNIGTALGSGENPFITHILVRKLYPRHIYKRFNAFQSSSAICMYYNFSLYAIDILIILYYDEVQFTHEKTNHGTITDAVFHTRPQASQSHSLLMALSLTPWRKARTRSKSNWMGDSMAGECRNTYRR
jgi:hypothetical protein